MQNIWKLIKKQKPNENQRVFISDGENIRVAHHRLGKFVSLEVVYKEFLTYEFWAEWLPLPDRIDYIDDLKEESKPVSD